MVTPFGFFRGNTSTPAPATVSTDVTAQANNTQSSAASPVIQSLQDAASGRMSHPISRRQSPTIATTTSNAMASPRPTLPPNALEIANSQAADLLRAMAQRSVDDDEHQIASGQTTPHPSLIDRRLPGIPHTFQQVCAGSSISKSLQPRLPVIPSVLKIKIAPFILKPQILSYYSRVLFEKASELTLGVRELEKETPPPTPRGTASTGSVTDDGSSSAAPTVAPSRSASGTTSPTNLTPAPRVGAPKGKLIVRIDEARNIRGSRDPYVVCTFESNEFISKGPKKEHDSGHIGNGGYSIHGPRGNHGISIPMKSRQCSDSASKSDDITSPSWGLEATFDVLGEHSEVDVSLYDRSQETFLGHVRICPTLTRNQTVVDGWYTLEGRGGHENVTGEIKLSLTFEKTAKKHYGPQDFQVLRLIGKGTFGQVYQVRKKDTNRIYAMKVLSKKVIVQKKEVAHTVGERNILVRTATTDSPFIVSLKFSFQTPTDLYLVTDYMSGGELFWHLQKEGRFKEDRARFYIAELILALEHLHNNNIVYRDLKPENILLDANGHIALCDFGLSKANLAANATTNTFCGTTEYLAPEVLLDETGYTKMVDFWSLGVLVFEMCCGWSPFYADDTQQMYKNIAFGKVRFPKDAMSLEGRNFVKGLLNRNPKHRLGAVHDAKELKEHPFFADVDWTALVRKDVIPPFKPKLSSETDTSNFDPEFTNAPMTGSLNARALGVANSLTNNTPLSPTLQANFRGFTFVDDSTMEEHFANRDSTYLDTMDEDLEEEWKHARGGAHHHDDDDGSRHHRESDGKRMSGVAKTGGDDQGIFGNDLDM
ncbi:kinase-like domain-containing protein [Peziza echinospora]|nr:kinase-like domain-containing protein [Peziza echinospora]